MANESKYDSHVKPHLEMIKAWTRDGVIESDIAKKLNVAYSTFSEYKHRYPELKETLKTTREIADKEVIGSLFKSANGFFVEETKTFIDIDSSGNEKKRVEIIKRYIPPNSTSIIYWLKNRQPLDWRDKPLETGQTEDFDKLKSFLKELAK